MKRIISINYNEFEYSQDFVIVFLKIDGALLECEVLYDNVYLYQIDYYQFFIRFHHRHYHQHLYFLPQIFKG